MEPDFPPGVWEPSLDPASWESSPLELSWFRGRWLSRAVFRTSSKRDPGRTRLLLLISILTPWERGGGCSAGRLLLEEAARKLAIADAVDPLRGFHFRSRRVPAAAAPTAKTAAGGGAWL